MHGLSGVTLNRTIPVERLCRHRSNGPESRRTFRLCRTVRDYQFYGDAMRNGFWKLIGTMPAIAVLAVAVGPAALADGPPSLLTRQTAPVRGEPWRFRSSICTPSDRFNQSPRRPALTIRTTLRPGSSSSAGAGIRYHLRTLSPELGGHPDQQQARDQQQMQQASLDCFSGFRTSGTSLDTAKIGKGGSARNL